MQRFQSRLSVGSSPSCHPNLQPNNTKQTSGARASHLAPPKGSTEDMAQLKTWSSPLALWAAPSPGAWPHHHHGIRFLQLNHRGPEKIRWPGAFILCLRMGDIWFLTPTVVYVLLHVPEKEGGDLSVRYWLGRTIARNKMQMDLFYAFQEEKVSTWTHRGWYSGWFCGVAGRGVG